MKRYVLSMEANADRGTLDIVTGILSHRGYGTKFSYNTSDAGSGVNQWEFGIGKAIDGKTLVALGNALGEGSIREIK